MKKLTVLILATCLLNPLLLPGARAQSSTAAAGILEQLRASIIALEKIERNGGGMTSSNEVATLNREFLTGKRRQLQAALLRRQTALEEYLLVAGASLNESEVQAVQRSLGDLRRELRSLGDSIAGADGARMESVAPISPGNVEAAPDDGSGARSGAAQRAEPASFVRTGWAARAAETSGALEPPLQEGVSNSCPSCLPDPALDEEKDFIINARTGEKRGKTRFGRSERARIIVTDKNPFLYEYRVTLKDKPIAEPAIAAFFNRFSLFAEELKEKTEAGAVKEALVSCPSLNEVTTVERQLAAEDSSTDANSLRNLYLAQKRAYDEAARQLKEAQDVLYSPNASCPTLCATATNIRSSLQNHRPALQQLSEKITRFKIRASFLQSEVSRLQQGAALSPACTTQLDQLRRLASDYANTADTFEKGLVTITNGKKTFDAAIKTINEVFANPNAFYQVYTRGPFSLPTDVEITVERRNLREESATFVKIGETETINFGGGARFAIAGGVVASPFESITYKRVPAIIDGRSTTIIGAENSSNSRILPILMLHGRLSEFKKPPLGFISGIHLSLGITAKPNDEGTNVEYLVGPSLSFIEERLFFTVGGYAGRRQQLEGNLAPGQELPAEFKDDIPINNRLVWKPGFALTYKFK